MRRILLLGATGVMLVGAAAMAATTEKLARLNIAETELAVDQGVNMHRLSRLLSVLQQLRRDPPPALLVSPQDARDAVRAAILVKAITPELQARAQGFAENATEVMRQRRLAAAQSEALFERDSLMADSQPEPDAATGIGMGRDGSEALTPPARLIVPVKGAVIGRFGAEIAGGGRSNGLTFRSDKGERALSPAAGLVQYVGQSVTEGQPLGWATGGRQSGAGLYLEVREQGSPVDPSRWLGQNRQGERNPGSNITG
jgi:septal ring factor EnvC (AmiA/AmiB activator)